MAFDKTFESEWSINNFSNIFKQNGQPLESSKFSDTFEGKSLEWKIFVYPNGRCYSCDNWLSVCVYICKDFVILTSSISFSIIKNNKRIIHNHKNKTKYDTSCEITSYLGFDKFVKRDFVINPENGVLDNNKLTIAFEFKLYGNDKEPDNIKVDKTFCDDNILQLAEFNKFEQLINDQEFSDVSLIIEGKTVRAHKCILASRSSVFAAMFRHQMTETLTNVVKIEDMKHDIFIELLRFIYAGRVNGIENIAEELLKAAEKYSIDGFQIRCEKALSDNLSIDNAIRHLQLADKYNLNTLKEHAINFIALHKFEIDEKSEFKLLMEMPQVLFNLCTALIRNYS